MSKVIDYAWARPSIADLKSVGTVAVCRYLSWLPNSKCLTKTEANNLISNGIDVISNWEYYGDWDHDYKGGYANGVIHSQEAIKQHRDCGGPAGRPIYFSTDFNPTASQLITVGEYYKGVASVIGIGRTGAYGGYNTIKYLFDMGLISYGWQTYAWSNGQWDSRANIRQVRNSVNLNGSDVDYNETQKEDYGQWGYNMAERVGNESLSDYLMRIERALWWPIPDVLQRVKVLENKLDLLSSKPTSVITDEQLEQLTKALLDANNSLSEDDYNGIKSVLIGTLGNLRIGVSSEQSGI